MSRNSNRGAASEARNRWAALPDRGNTKQTVRAILGGLLGLNLIALGLVMWPIGGSAEDLEKQMVELRGQLRARQQQIERGRTIVSKVEKGRTEAEKFFDQYFLSQRTASPTILSELQSAAKQSQIGVREHSINAEPVEGSDTLTVWTITGNYEGTYADLMQYVNRIDRSDRLLIIESLNAAPQQGGGRLNVTMKLEVFVREDRSPIQPAVREVAAQGVAAP